MTRKMLLAGGLLAVLAAGPVAAQTGWQAEWIWAAEEPATDMLLARRCFDLPAAPDSAVLRISASTVYKLYINGKYVSRGPARCAPHHQSYDELDVASLLGKGTNVLAVRIHYQTGTVSYHHAGRAGLLVQVEVSAGGETSLLTTDRSWRVLPDPAWDARSPRMSRFHLEVCDRMDLRHSPGDWTSQAFDDGAWPQAQPLIRRVGWPGPQANDRPHALTIPWTALVPRDIPLLTEQDVPATNLIQAQPVGGDAFAFADRDGEGPGIIKAVRLTGQIDPACGEDMNVAGWFLLYDFGEVVDGLPRLDIEGPAGTVVDVMCAPYIVDESFTANIVDSQFIDRVILSGGRDQWEAAYFKPTRYMGIAIRGASGPVKLHGAGIHQLAYPFETKGSLRTPEDPWFEACWDAAAKTIRVCTTDAYTDNYRERRQYVQTAYYASLGNTWTFGDTALQRRCLRQAAEEQEANGMMPACAPRFGDDFMVILDSNTAWIRGLRNYLLYSGDDDTVRELLPAARKLMGLLDGYTDALGLLDDPPFAYWLDHALNDRRGANFCLNGHYLGALEDFAEVLGWLDEPGADEFQARADRVRASLRDRFWNPDRRLFCDALVEGDQSSMFSEHANAMALAMRVATGEQAEAIAAELLANDRHDYVRRASGITMVTPAMSYLLHEGLCQYGHVRESLGMLRARFDRMLQPDTNQTLWEEWWLDGTARTGRLVKGRTRSDAQTESAFPPALFGQFILGLRPLKPGLREIALVPPDCGLSRIEGVMPTPLGSLRVKWNLESGDLQVGIPKGMQVQLDLGALRAKGRPSVSVDNEPVATADPAKASITLPEGDHHVRF